MRIVQLLDALDFGDGVSNDVINIGKLLNDMGVSNIVYSKFANEKVMPFRKDIKEYSPKIDDIILYHYSGKSSIIEQVIGYHQPVVLMYHNITPPNFFSGVNNDIERSCEQGLEQIKKYIGCFSWYCGDSNFNNADLISYGADEKRVDTFPIIISFEKCSQMEMDESILRDMDKHVSILFVGRFAPNKKIEDVLDVFENYYKYYNNNSTLYLVGNTEQAKIYTQFIKKKIEVLSCKNNIVITGKVDEKKLYSYYKGADVFLCMSEHEGFCIPLIEAMKFDVPVVAYNAGAVAETLGNSGVLVNKKNIPVISSLLNELVNNSNLNSIIVSQQKNRLKFFSYENLKAKMSVLLSKWETLLDNRE